MRTKVEEFTHTNYERFRDLVLEKSGLYFAPDKRHTLCKGLAEALTHSPCTNLDDYYELLLKTPPGNDKWDHLIGLLTVGETYFFRNKGHFDALANHILPQIIAQREHSNRRIRIWSAGCSSGEEPYSIAMLLRELIPNIDSWNILILATDINRAALRSAQSGQYGLWSFRGVEQDIQKQYFTPDGKDKHIIAQQIKRMVSFDYLNLIEDNYPSLLNRIHGMDVILCRNVTIYFIPETTERVIGQLYQSLVGGGWLIPGASELNTITFQAFECRNFPGAVVYEKSKGAASLASKSVPSQPTPIAKTPRPKPTPTDPYQSALKALEAGQIKVALVELYKKLDQDPEFAPTFYTLGKIYANQGQLEDAQCWCERAIGKDKLNPAPYFTLAMIYQAHDLPDKAINFVKKALYLDPMFILAHYTLANIYLQQGKAELAQRSLRNARRLLTNRARQELIPEGDGLVAGRLLELVEMQLKIALKNQESRLATRQQFSLLRTP